MRSAITSWIIVGALAVAGCEGGKPAAGGHDHAAGAAHDDGHGHADARHVADAHAHGEAPHSDAPAPVARPASVADAAAKIEAAYAELGAVIREGDLSRAHPIADRMARLAEPLAELATAEKRAPGDIRDLNVAARELRDLFAPLDAAADAGKRAEAQAAFARYEGPIATIRAKAASGAAR